MKRGDKLLVLPALRIQVATNYWRREVHQACAYMALSDGVTWICQLVIPAEDGVRIFLARPETEGVRWIRGWRGATARAFEATVLLERSA